MTAEKLPDWVFPPPGGFTADDLDRIPIVLDRENRPEPDLTVLHERAVPAGGHAETSYRAEDVVLAVEVVSPESASRDRARKPQLYAHAGIPHFWLVERMDGGRPVVHTYELDRLGHAYALTGIHHDRLKLSAPFTIDIDLTEIDRM